jgi:hypothetical protein
MPHGAIVAIALFGLVFVMRKPILRIVALLLVRRAVRGALSDVGTTALAKTAQRVTLVPEDVSSRRSSEVESRYVRPLQESGFVPAGAFVVEQTPGVHLQMLVQPGHRVQANVYEHPQVGTWLELVCRYENGNVFTVTDLPSRGIDAPSWITTRRVEPSTPVATMMQRLLKERPQAGLEATSPENAKQQFELGYERFMAWKKKTGISAQEVARQIPRFLESKADAAATQESPSGRP